MQTVTKSLKVGDRTTTAIVYKVPVPVARVLLAHGAGAGQDHPWMIAAATALAARSIEVVTFDFPYKSEGRKLPDPPVVLEATWQCVVTAFTAGSLPVFLGGKSMGGRVASQWLASHPDARVRGLFFLGYPLHPPGKPAQLRDEHFARLEIPLLFVQGERDTFGNRAEIEPLATRTRAQLHVVPGGDHSFTVGKTSKISQRECLETVWNVVATWILAR